MAPPLIYVAGPYTRPDPVENTHRTVKAALALRDDTGCAVLIPHLTLLAHAIEPRDVDYWYEFDLDQIHHCSALWRLDGESTGADREVDHAYAFELPIFLGDGGRADLVELIAKGLL
jgi:hypothetical protein